MPQFYFEFGSWKMPFERGHRRLIVRLSAGERRRVLRLLIMSGQYFHQQCQRHGLYRAAGLLGLCRCAPKELDARVSNLDGNELAEPG